MSESGSRENCSREKANPMTLMRFFSIDTDTEVNINNPGVRVPNFTDIWSGTFILKVMQLVIGFICVGLYSEGLRLIDNSVNTMMFPNIVFSSFLIITGVIVLSCMLGCHMPDVHVRVFNILGMLLYFASSTLTLYVSIAQPAREGTEHHRVFLLITSITSYLNTIAYGADVYLSIKKAVGCELQL